MFFQPKESIKKFLNRNMGITVLDVLIMGATIAVAGAVLSTLLENSNITISITSRKLHSY